jgi:hypothetical protein
MRKLVNRKIVEQDRRCAICHEDFTDYSGIVPDHSFVSVACFRDALHPARTD